MKHWTATELRQIRSEFDLTLAQARSFAAGCGLPFEDLQQLAPARRRQLVRFHLSVAGGKQRGPHPKYGSDEPGRWQKTWPRK
ncbi:MAG: hypothetical protein ACR2L2_07845 [Acidobacteriota bacterium]